MAKSLLDSVRAMMMEVLRRAVEILFHYLVPYMPNLGRLMP